MAGVGGERPAAPEPPGTSQPLTAFILPLPPRLDVSGGDYAGGNGGSNRSTAARTTEPASRRQKKGKCEEDDNRGSEVHTGASASETWRLL